MPTSYPRPPCVIKLKGFQKKKEKNGTWFSDPVYSHFGGYKMCLSVDANGNGSGKDTHVSVYVGSTTPSCYGHLTVQENVSQGSDIS